MITTKLAKLGLGLGLMLSVACKPSGEPASVAPDSSVVSPVEAPAPVAEPEPEPEPEIEPEPNAKLKPKPQSSGLAAPKDEDSKRTILCCTTGSGREGVGCQMVPNVQECSGGFTLACAGGYSCNKGDCACFD